MEQATPGAGRGDAEMKRANIGTARGGAEAPREDLEAEHGGPDGGGDIRLDFSTNAHPGGSNPFVLERLGRADRSRYPDPGYGALRARLAAFHGVDPERVVVGASASELIWRLTLAFRTVGGTQVATTGRTFAEYGRAARALGLTVAAASDIEPGAQEIGAAPRGPTPDEQRRALPEDGSCPTPAGALPNVPALRWICNPDNPSGAFADAAVERALEARGIVVVDLAYQPFRALLAGQGEIPGVPAARWAGRVVQLFSPNKLHGLTGVRGAYLVLPTAAASLGGAADDAADARVGESVESNPRRGAGPTLDHALLRRLAPSWVLGAEGVAMLEAHAEPGAREALMHSVPTLAHWKRELDARLDAAGWRREPSALHFGLYRPPLEAPPTDATDRTPTRESRPPDFMDWMRALRAQGIKVRDAGSFGRPGWVRLRTLDPDAVGELIEATRRFVRRLEPRGEGRPGKSPPREPS